MAVLKCFVLSVSFCHEFGFALEQFMEFDEDNSGDIGKLRMLKIVCALYQILTCFASVYLLSVAIEI